MRALIAISFMLALLAGAVYVAYVGWNLTDVAMPVTVTWLWGSVSSSAWLSARASWVSCSIAVAMDTTSRPHIHRDLGALETLNTSHRADEIINAPSGVGLVVVVMPSESASLLAWVCPCASAPHLVP